MIDLKFGEILAAIMNLNKILRPFMENSEWVVFFYGRTWMIQGNGTTYSRGKESEQCWKKQGRKTEANKSVKMK